MALVSFIVVRGRLTWLALQRSSEIKNQDQYNEIGDPTLYLTFNV